LTSRRADPAITDHRAAAVAAWLEWHALAGVDCLLASGAAPAATLPPPRPAGPAHAAVRPGLDATLDSLRGLARSCRSLDELARAVEGLDACPLRATATRTCFAAGSPSARVMLVGEAPGAEEDRQGVPFVGESGQLLDRMLAEIGLDRGAVWITNLVFWRPPGNRQPTPAELAVCLPFVERQIEIVAPRVLVLLGGAAARALLGTREPVGALRGRRLSYEPETGPAIEVVVSYHPANLLRTPLNKRYVWRDLLRLSALLESPGAGTRPVH
jgi:uracil-DNA glycosylase family 4